MDGCKLLRSAIEGQIFEFAIASGEEIDVICARNEGSEDFFVMIPYLQHSGEIDRAERALIQFGNRVVSTPGCRFPSACALMNFTLLN